MMLPGLIIRSSSIHAAGCYTMRPIKKGARVCEYEGPRMTKAVADGISARVTLDEAQFALKRAYAASQKAASSVGEESSHVQTARDHLADLALRAPPDGTVAMRFKDPGATVAAGTPVVRIVGHGGVRLRFAVPPDHAQ